MPIDIPVYEVSFELLTLSSDNQYREFKSPEVVSVRSWPYEGEYKIFGVTTGPTGSVRGGEQSGLARVSFEVR